MSSLIQKYTRIRRSFGKIESLVNLPNLIAFQRKSYEDFLQMNVSPEERSDTGLQAVFKSIFPITDYQGTCSLEFIKYHIEPPKYDVDECRQRGLNYEATVRVTIRLIIWEKPMGDDDEGIEQSVREIRDFKEEEVFFGTIPLITEYGTFLINGVERVVVSQLHRSPGVFFDHDKGKAHASRKLLYSARVIPARGSWLDFEFDAKDILYVRIDRRKKMHASVLLRALGMSTREILDTYYFSELISPLEEGAWKKETDLSRFEGFSFSMDIISPDDRNKVLIPRKKKLNKKLIRDAKKLGGDTQLIHDSYLLGKEGFLGKVVADDIIDPATGEVLAVCNQPVTKDLLKRIRECQVKSFRTYFIDNRHVHEYMRQTVSVDKIESPDEALIEIYKRMRPGEPPTLETARRFFDGLFFDPSRYDLSRVGRMKINMKFKYKDPDQETILTIRDIKETIRFLLRLRENEGQIDDIDHLGNRRIRAVGELLEIQYRSGLERLKRAVRERMATSGEMETSMPHDLINSRPVASAVREYFASSQLSQFMDQTNPLSEITHKRRLSALGPGGLTRERAGFDVRDVHPTHYGRICPIETPEGPNIGLIASLASHARINDFGFIETPYRKVDNRRALKADGDIKYYNAIQEEERRICEATVPLEDDGTIVPNIVSVRQGGEVMNAVASDVELMDVAPEQLVSVAASLIPFLEHDDANRALMGANMQRQAVPLLNPRAPLVATKMEPNIARDSGVTMVARRSGTVVMVDGARIVVKPDADPNTFDPASVKPDIYTLVKFRRTNQSTCYNQKPIVEVGDRVKAGDVIADGPSTEMGELALGQNVTVAFMPWSGYNFEDSILINERLVREDVFTSIHIEEYECDAKETKLGAEEITRDIPNVSEEALRDLDESGIVRIGAEVKSGDILVGKVTPKGETQLTPEEKLLKAIFGEKAGDVKDSSLRVPPGVQGIVIAAQIFSRRNQEKDKRAREIEETLKETLLTDQMDEIRILSDSFYSRMKKLLLGQTTSARLIDDHNKVLLPKGQVLDGSIVDRVPRRYWSEIQIKDSNGIIENKLESLAKALNDSILEIENSYRDKIARLTKTDDLGTGVLKKVKVYVAIKRKLSVGDKMAGRHGNKGVVSRILASEDMPYMADGTPVDIVLNPLGVPSRMNVGQILETHLGLAARELGRQINQYVQETAWHPDVIRAQLRKLYPSEGALKFISRLTEDDLRRWAEKSKEGIHVFTPVFEGANEDEIKSFLKMAGQDTSGQLVLFDGRTGEAFHRPVTVGIMYMLKLHHLVDDKIHARSTGPYALVTQQPLGGKAQFGGQRLGEMEVWAIEAYGAAYSLQEFLTVKSDDVTGRTRMFEAIVKGTNTLQSGLPESFNVLLKELQSLCLNMETIGDDNRAIGRD